MPVIRVEKTKDYTVMANYHLRDKNLSLKAIGLLSMILSLPSDWDYTVEGLASICKDKRDCIRKAVIELEENGYITRSRQRLSNGTLGDMEYTVREKPKANDQQTKKPALENPTLDKPMLDKPTLENPTQLNTNISNTEKESTKGQSTDVYGADAPRQNGKSASFKPPSVEEVKAYCEERHNGIDPDKFVDYYTAQGWRLSNGQPMKDWKAAVRNWEHRNKPSNGVGSFDEDDFLKAALARTYDGK